ncbi:MAG: AraC family transcriptional regulator [Andreesenia angusta]|nr:AraC family transcriptional regulator [Andreesenia angusta]
MELTGNSNYMMTLYNKSNYYKHFIFNSKNGDVLLLKGNGYNVTGDSLVYRVADGLHMFKIDAVYRDADLKGLDSYIEDTLMIYKIMKGNILFATKDGKERRLNCGDILNAAGNFKMSKFHSFNKEIECIGISFYYKGIMNAIENQSLNKSFLEEFYKSDLLHNIFIHRGNYKINKLFQEIKNVIDDDNKILMKAKSFELLSESAIYHNDFVSIDYKGLSKEKTILFNNIKEFLDNNLDQYYSMEFIAEKFFISLSGLKNIFYQVYGISPYIYHLNKRLEKAAILLTKSDYKIKDIYKKVGFNYHSNFSKAFQKKYNCTPSQYRKRGS